MVEQSFGPFIDTDSDMVETCLAVSRAANALATIPHDQPANRRRLRIRALLESIASRLSALPSERASGRRRNANSRTIGVDVAFAEGNAVLADSSHLLRNAAFRTIGLSLARSIKAYVRVVTRRRLPTSIGAFPTPDPRTWRGNPDWRAERLMPLAPFRLTMQLAFAERTILRRQRRPISKARKS